MAAVLLVSASATGALAGFVAGVAWEVVRLPGLGPWGAAVVVVVAVLAELAWLRTGRPRPWSVGRQVPRAWSDEFAPATVALLYGARLGVGPLTILRTWLWWAVLLAGAASGVWPATVALAAFGAVRALTMIAAAEWARAAMPVRMARLRGLEPLVGRAVLAVAIVAAAAWPFARFIR